MPAPERPTNAIELPIYTALKFKWWPPVQLTLARPWPNANHALHAHEARWSPESLAALTSAPFDPDTGFELDADTVLVVERPTHRGRPIAVDSMQFVLQFGMEASPRAQALLQIWRDDAIERRCLGSGDLRFEADPWWRKAELLEASVYQLIERSAAKVDMARQAIIFEEISMGARANAVIAARGTATLCGGANAARLLAEAFEKYAPCDDTLHTFELPEVDRHMYDAPEVVELAAAFCKRGLDGLLGVGMPRSPLRTVRKKRVRTKRAPKKGGATKRRAPKQRKNRNAAADDIHQTSSERDL